MFTGIIQATAHISHIQEHGSLRSLTLEFSPGFCQDLAIGASVAVDGVCLTVTHIVSPICARFDVVQQTLGVTTLGSYGVHACVNAERAARDGAEIGGHPLSGHIDCTAELLQVDASADNCRMRFGVPEAFRRYVFAKGYIAVNGASLTVAEVDRAQGWFDVWLIPETRRMTTFEAKRAGDLVNVEIERQTQIIVDTVRESVGQSLHRLQDLLAQQGIVLDDWLNGDCLPVPRVKNHLDVL